MVQEPAKGCTFDIILWSLVQYDKILSKFGQQQLVVVNYVGGFNQSEAGKYFKWIINNIIGWGFSRVKANADNTYRDLDYLHSSPTLQIPA